MRCLGLLLGLGLTACQAVVTGPVFHDVSGQCAQVLRHCDAQGGWELAFPPALPSDWSYRLPKTQVFAFRCDVRDPETFFDRAELEFTHFLRKHGALGVAFRRRVSGATYDLTWTYAEAGREGVLTLWAACEDDRIRDAIITIHESRTP